jgi:hypothetical protein
MDSTCVALRPILAVASPVFPVTMRLSEYWRWETYDADSN